jgi:hypothetical protein
VCSYRSGAAESGSRGRRCSRTTHRAGGWTPTTAHVWAGRRQAIRGRRKGRKSAGRQVATNTTTVSQVARLAYLRQRARSFTLTLYLSVSSICLCPSHSVLFSRGRSLALSLSLSLAISVFLSLSLCLSLSLHVSIYLYRCPSSPPSLSHSRFLSPAPHPWLLAVVRTSTALAASPSARASSASSSSWWAAK